MQQQPDTIKFTIKNVNQFDRLQIDEDENPDQDQENSDIQKEQDQLEQNQPLEEDQNEYEEQDGDQDLMNCEEPQDNLEQQETIKNFNATKTLNLPVNEHIQKIENMLIEVVDDLELDKKQLQVLRGEILNISFLYNDQSQNLNQFVFDECQRINKVFRKLVVQVDNDRGDIKEQVNQLNQERIKNQETLVLLDHKINENENNVGFKEFFQ